MQAETQTATHKSMHFSSKLAMILTCMGMAVGTGNIWRFPREVARNGGGEFLVPWLLFLFLWSVPLLMIELSVGQRTRRGPFGAFANLLGNKFAWMGGFISICAMMIMCYYAVITGWTFRYFALAVTGSMNALDYDGAINLFDTFRGTTGSLVFHWLALGVTAIIVYKGTTGIERLNKILIPMLIVILAFAAINALMLDGAFAGLGYLFSIDGSRFGNADHWIAGLTQSAWSTGAGWGLMLSYAVYAREKEDPITTPMATGLGNNGIEVLVGLMIFPAVFAIMGNLEAEAFISNTSSLGGIAFQATPMLFREMPMTGLLNILFFLGLASAALTSLVAMVELSARFFQDFGLTRGKALALTIGLCLFWGTPSALSDDFFGQQDYIWGVGLIISGLLLILLVILYGPERFITDILNRNASWLKAGRWFKIWLVIAAVEGLCLLGWWLYTMAQGSPGIFKWCLIQWGVVLLALILFNRKLTTALQAQQHD